MEKELNIDWANLSFGYIPTDYNVRCTYKNGEWGEIEVSSSELIPMHMAASCLHYGQEAFEGLKAFRGKDGQVRVFRMDENAKRIQRSAEGIMMPALPVEKFMEMVKMVVRLDARFIPPYGSGASLYIRPLEIGMSAQVGVKPATEYLFVIFVTPVGPYFKGGFKTTPYVITRKYDRAAPLGTGTFKVGETMPQVCVQAARLTLPDIRQSSISTHARRNIWTSVALPTSSESRTTHTSLRCLRQSFRQSPTRALCSSPRIWASRWNAVKSRKMSLRRLKRLALAERRL